MDINDKKVTQYDSTWGIRFTHPIQSDFPEVTDDDGSLPYTSLTFYYDGREYSDADIVKFAEEVKFVSIVETRVASYPERDTFLRSVTIAPNDGDTLMSKLNRRIIGEFMQFFVDEYKEEE